MLQRFIGWSVHNPLVVILLTGMLVGVGGYAFTHVNVEAYPDPAPAIVEVIAQFNGASAEEVERQVTIPLEVTFAGIPGMNACRTRSLFGLCHLRLQFDYGITYEKARQEVINRIQFTQPLPPNVAPVLSPTSPTGEIYRYTLTCPHDESGDDVYNMNDLKALQDWSLEREFRFVPGVIDVSSAGGTVKRYEITPYPDRLIRYHITLSQLQNALANANQNTGGDVLMQGGNALNVRGLGLFGRGLDPMQSKEVFRAKTPKEAARVLRREELARIKMIRNTVVTSLNNVPITVANLVDREPITLSEQIGRDGVFVSNQTRLGKVSLSKPRRDENGRILKDQNGNILWSDEEEKVQCIVLLRKGEDSLPALEGVHEKVRELNDPASGTMLPGVKIEPYYDRTELIGITTETVRENLVLGMVLVSMILLMFLGNVRVALIVAVNIPLALLFAFAALFARGRSANLLSIGAVDFGIIVDSSVIMAENIYRKLSAGEHPELPIADRILLSSGEIQRALLFSTAIMICAFIPLFAMQGAEGQLFGPMADTYAFALGGGLLLATMLTPTLCRFFLKHVRPKPDNFIVRHMKSRYLHNLERCLNYRWFFVLFMLTAIGVTYWKAKADLGREFMPELEEGNLWVRGMYPRSSSLDTVSTGSRDARAVLRRFPEVEAIANQMGRPDDGTDPEGFYKSEFFVPLRPRSEWPAVVKTDGMEAWFGDKRPRTKQELIAEMLAGLRESNPGVDWNFSQNIRDNVMESISGVKGDNSLKIYGPDLEELQRLAKLASAEMRQVAGVEDVGILEVMGQPNLEIPWDSDKCKQWGVTAADLQNVLSTAVGGAPFSQMIEGEKKFDISLRWPRELRDNTAAILEIPVDIVNNQVQGGYQPQVGSTRTTGTAVGLTTYGTTNPGPTLSGSQYSATGNYIAASPRRLLKHLVTPMNKEGELSDEGNYVRPGASMIFREQKKRMIAVKFSVRNRDLAGAVKEAQDRVAPMIAPPYHTRWGGEFEQMEAAERRLMYIIPLALMLIFMLLYMAFHSLLDAAVVLSNVVALSIGGIWGLLLTGVHFSTSAAVGFVSLFGVAIMDGLLMISYFNSLRAHGVPLREAILQGAEKRVRPVVMTAMTAILGLLPAAIALRPAWDEAGDFRWIEPIGVQTQRPLAIVVVGGMLTTLILTRYLMPVLYSFYGSRTPPSGAGDLAH